MEEVLRDDEEGDLWGGGFAGGGGVVEGVCFGGVDTSFGGL